MFFLVTLEAVTVSGGRKYTPLVKHLGFVPKGGVNIGEDGASTLGRRAVLTVETLALVSNILNVHCTLGRY